LRKPLAVLSVIAVVAVAAIWFLGAGGEPAESRRTDVVVGMQLEPPVLDPTINPAAAIAQITQLNIFEGRPYLYLSLAGWGEIRRRNGFRFWGREVHVCA
jgi:hypothetical protein